MYMGIQTSSPDDMLQDCVFFLSFKSWAIQTVLVLALNSEHEQSCWLQAEN